MRSKAHCLGGLPHPLDARICPRLLSARQTYRGRGLRDDEILQSLFAQENARAARHSRPEFYGAILMPTATKKIPYVDIAGQHKLLKAELLKAVADVIDHGKFILG